VKSRGGFFVCLLEAKKEAQECFLKNKKKKKILAVDVF